MKKIFLVSGFLGSGKTTFILQLMEYFAKNKRKVALIVNELGEIGIDNQYMKQLGYNVWELFGGCICCTLSNNLESTLEELRQNYNPDIILVEPSGGAEPKMIYESFINLNFTKESIHNFFILDPTRIDMFLEILTPLFHSSLELADIVIINKIDKATEDELSLSIGSIAKEIPYFQLNFHEKFSDDFKQYLNLTL